MKTLTTNITLKETTGRLLFVLLLVLAFVSCRKEYPEEPTQEGIDNHGFILNGNKWARGIIWAPPALHPARYDDELELFSLNMFSSIIGKGEQDSHIYLHVYVPKNVELPFTSNIVGTPDSLEANYDLISQLSDPTKTYILFEYRENKESKWEVFKNDNISGNLKITRMDSIVSGTFEASISNDIKSFSLEEGKFDYKLEPF